jgi:hypothetical protein
MSEQDRGAYAPQTEAPLAFDPRQPRRGGRPPVALLFSAIVLMALVVAVLLFYRHGVRHPNQPPQILGAPVAETKAPPPSSAGATDPASGLQVYKSEATPASETGSSAAPAFESAPEQPAPLPPARPVAPPPSVMNAPLRGAASAPSTAPRPPAPRPVVIVKAAPPKPTPPVTVPLPSSAPTHDTANVAGSAFSSHAASSARPAAHAAASSAPPRPIAVTATAPSAKPAIPAKPKPKPATPVPGDELAAAPHAATGGGAMVQVGAFASGALADKGWSDAAHLMPGQMSGKTRKIETTVKDGKTFYRAYVGGFASKADAQSFCAALKAKGKACFLK